MKPAKLPTIFERIFLSHLVILACTCTVCVSLYLYLIGDSAHFLLKHNPIIVIPSALLLIGVTGLVTTWAAKSIARPIEKTTDSLKSERAFHFAKGHEEIARLVEGIELQLQLHRASESHTRFQHNQEAQSLDTTLTDIISKMKDSIRSLAHSVSDISIHNADVTDPHMVSEMKNQVIALMYETSRLASLRAPGSIHERSNDNAVQNA